MKLLKLAVITAITLTVASCTKPQTHEESCPECYLKTTGSLEMKMFKNIVSGSITNTATKAEYSDATIKVQYLSETGYPVETKYFTVNEYFKPNEPVKYKFEMPQNDKRRSFTVQVTKARLKPSL